MVFNTNLGQSLRISSWNEPVWSATSFFSPLYQNWIFFFKWSGDTLRSIKNSILGVPSWLSQRGKQLLISGLYVWAPHWLYTLPEKKKNRILLKSLFPEVKRTLYLLIFSFFFFFWKCITPNLWPKEGGKLPWDCLFKDKGSILVLEFPKWQSWNCVHTS